MCGIVGYIGEKNGIPIVIDGLKRLEYRGYDSSGLCYFKSNQIQSIKKKGKVSDLESLITKKNVTKFISHMVRKNLQVKMVRDRSGGINGQIPQSPWFNTRKKVSLPIQ